MKEFLCFTALFFEDSPEQDLKPAFLIQSQCHYDIARQMKRLPNSDAAQADRHMTEAIKWLQRLYGTYNEVAMTDNGIIMPKT